MKEDFQSAFQDIVLPALIEMLSDSVPRVHSHACAALTNMLEEITEDVAIKYADNIIPKLEQLIEHGISITKENAITTYATVAESLKGKFVPYYERFLQFCAKFLTAFHEKCYKQFKGQLIEAITIASASVGVDAFRPHAPDIIRAMLAIQNAHLESKDPQRTYLLSAWQRICLLMKKEFVPYLKEVVPSLFSLATLNPEMSIQGSKTADIGDVLDEVTTSKEGGKKKISVNTDEIEEKDVALQMLIVFIDELEDGFAEFIEPTSRILIGLAKFTANESIRSSVAGGFPGLIKSAKLANPGNSELLISMGQTYMNALWEAIKEETDTDTLMSQVQSIKHILEEIGFPIMNQEVVNQLTSLCFNLITKSEQRVEENENIAKNNNREDEEDDDEVDKDELELLKDENKNEFDLQLSIAELFGTLFKTHPTFCQPLIYELYQNFIPRKLQAPEKQKKKLALYILDDMIEFLGKDIMGPLYPTVAPQIIAFCQDPIPSLRQAACYGIGMMAKHGGEFFSAVRDICLQGISATVAMQPPHDKTAKVKHFMHARDNAISALGKILKYQRPCVDVG